MDSVEGIPIAPPQALIRDISPPPHPPQKTPPLSGPVCDRQATPHTPASPCASDQVIDESEKNVQEPKLAREQRGSRGLKV